MSLREIDCVLLGARTYVFVNAYLFYKNVWVFHFSFAGPDPKGFYRGSKWQKFNP